MNELNLYQLFKDIISKSKVMRRFVVAPQYGVELNKNNVGEILKDVLGGISDGVKYPLCIMFPPVEMIDDYEKGWSRFKCRLFFMTTEFNDRNGIQNRNSNNNLSQHTIQMTWKDMRDCAVDFRKVFQEVVQKNMKSGIRDSQSYDVIDRYSTIGNDQTAGVGISFEVDLFIGCEIIDYSDEDINSIVINTTDLHKSHEH